MKIIIAVFTHNCVMISKASFVIRMLSLSCCQVKAKVERTVIRVQGCLWIILSAGCDILAFFFFFTRVKLACVLCVCAWRVKRGLYILDVSSGLK